MLACSSATESKRLSPRSTGSERKSLFVPDTRSFELKETIWGAEFCESKIDIFVSYLRHFLKLVFNLSI